MKIPILSLFVALDFIKLISAIVTSSGLGIGLGVICIIVDGVMLVAIIQEWEVVITIGRVALLIVIVISVIAIFIKDIDMDDDGSDPETKRDSSIPRGISFGFTLATCGFLFFRIGDYVEEMERTSIA
uniref:Uncharacterized protein n=1 Tax=Tetranychus urticae TaxID=32264 RepID=T1JY10_TETUR